MIGSSAKRLNKLPKVACQPDTTCGLLLLSCSYKHVMAADSNRRTLGMFHKEHSKRGHDEADLKLTSGQT